jgi:hypothetical protein
VPVSFVPPDSHDPEGYLPLINLPRLYIASTFQAHTQYYRLLTALHWTIVQLVQQQKKIRHVYERQSLQNETIQPRNSAQNAPNSLPSLIVSTPSLPVTTSHRRNSSSSQWRSTTRPSSKLGLSTRTTMAAWLCLTL